MNVRGNSGNSGQLSARRYSIDISKTLPIAYVKYVLSFIFKDTILFCFKSKIIYETIYTTCGWDKKGRM